MAQVSLFPDFKEFLKLLNSVKVRYLVLGGYAVNFHGYHRTTGDLDVWIAVDPPNAEAVSQALQKFGFRASTVTPATFLEEGKVFRFGRRPVRIELLTNPSGISFEECYQRRIEAVMDGVKVPLICLDDLRVNKKASARAKDLADLENLPLPEQQRKRARKPR
jgi:predicted nucleotidyltransferase